MKARSREQQRKDVWGGEEAEMRVCSMQQTNHQISYCRGCECSQARSPSHVARLSPHTGIQPGRPDYWAAVPFITQGSHRTGSLSLRRWGPTSHRSPRGHQASLGWGLCLPPGLLEEKAEPIPSNYETVQARLSL